MKRWILMWNALLAGEPVLAIRAQAVAAFLAVVGINAGLALHREGLTGFCAGAALALSGILTLQALRLKSAETKCDPDANTITELHLSR